MMRFSDYHRLEGFHTHLAVELSVVVALNEVQLRSKGERTFLAVYFDSYFQSRHPSYVRHQVRHLLGLPNWSTKHEIMNALFSELLPRWELPNSRFAPDWYADFIEALSAIAYYNLTLGWNFWMGRLLVHFFEKKSLHTEGMQMLLQLVGLLVKNHMGEDALLVAKRLPDFDYARMEIFKGNFPYVQLGETLIMLFDECGEEVAEPLFLTFWGKCKQELGSKGEGYRQFVQLAYNFYMHTEISEQRCRYFERIHVSLTSDESRYF